jgi:PAS domain S-box-containing protein
MKKKAYLPAMSNKFFLGLWFVLFASAVLFVNWLLNRPLNQIDALNYKLAETGKQITRLKTLHAEYLLNYDQGDNLFINPENTAEIEAKSIITGIKQDLKYLADVRYLRRKHAITASLDEFSNVLSGFENNLNDFFLAYREKGNAKSGLVSRWRELSNRMRTVANPPGADVLLKLNAIRQSEANYLLQNDTQTLESISGLCEDIRSELIPEEGGIDINDLDSYVALTGNLIALDKRIGSAETGGIIAGLGRSLIELPASYENLRELIRKAGVKVQQEWKISRLVIILLLIALCIYLFLRLTSNQVFHPLKQLDSVAQKMALGELPEEKVMPGKLPEIISLQESLEKQVSRLRDKVTFTRSLNEQRMDTHLTLSGENDLLGRELLELQQKMIGVAEQQAKNEEENLRRRYINEGLAKFGDILRTKSNDINALGDAFIREIVKYLNAIQGGFFVYDDTDKSAPVLNLVSAFAYNRKKYLQKSIAYGEGLIGTCAREKQSINLTEIPAGYISITSGLGDTLPDNLLLIPVLHENELIGVLEIASLHKYKEHEITFAEEVAHNLGSVIVYTRNNQSTANLLAKSQQQALEMSEQEEEMRQNMEELKATQEESSRREEEFKGIADAIERALFIIEYDLDGHIRHVNDRFCIFSGYSYDEITGRTHKEVFNSTLNPDQQFWDDLQLNTQFTCIEDIKVGNTTVHLKEHFTLVQNRDGMTVKYINFATDD